MPSKKELMKKIEELESRLLQLENMRARILPANSWQSTRGLFLADPFEKYTHYGMEGTYCGRQLTAKELRSRYEHPMTKERGAWTKKVSGVTHEELAQFVLDGTPIERKQEGKVVYTTTYAPGTKTQSVKTDIGDISIQHDFKR
jgi:hypothetical protein